LAVDLIGGLEPTRYFGWPARTFFGDIALARRASHPNVLDGEFESAPYGLRMDDFNRAFDAIFGRDDLVPMGEAIDQYARAIAAQSRGSELYRNSIAERLSRRLTLYSVSEDGATTRAITAAELRNTRFAQGGEALVFRDGRQPVSPLAVKRSELVETIKALKA
jgi:hypothetical protein